MISLPWSACTVMVALFCAERDTDAARKAVLTNSFAFINGICLMIILVNELRKRQRSIPSRQG